MFVQYFEHYGVILRWAVFSWTRCIQLFYNHHTGQPVLDGTVHYELESFVAAKFYYPYAHADSNQHSRIREKGKERKGKEEYLYSAKEVHSKRSGMDHTVLNANNPMPAFPP